MKQLLFIAAGGAIGAVMRYLMANGIYNWLGRGFPYGTLLVNVSGSLAMGLLYVLLIERLDFDTAWRAGIVVGLLGAFTTFSTFSIETLNLLEAGEQFKAGMNVLASVVLCLLGCWLGLLLGRQI